MSSFNQAVGCFKPRREIKSICAAFSGQNQQGDALRLSVNGREVTLPAKIDAGNQVVKLLMCFTTLLKCGWGKGCTRKVKLKL